MSSNLDALRKQYEHLSPFERAVMVMEAVERKDESAVDALKPPTLWDAFHVMGDKLTFGTLAFSAVHESQRSETQYWLSMAMLGMMERQKIKGKEEEGPGYDEEFDTWVDRVRDGQRRARAWLVALEALDKETGGACMSYARLFAGGHISYIMDREVAEEVDYSAELDYLREMWSASMKNSPEAPKAA